MTVGDALVSLKALRFLDLHQNKLEVFPELPEKAALDQVLLGFNSLQAISDSSIMRVRDTITVLDVRDNRLRTVPEKIAHLFRIKTLDLTNNDLNELPAGLGYLKDLHHLMVEGNPLRTIRRAVVSGGSEMLKKYLRTRGGPPVGVEALEEEFDEFALRDKQQQSELLLGATASAESISSQHEYLFRDAASSGSLQLVGMGLMSLPPHLQGHGKFNFSATLVQLNLSKNKIGILPKEIGELAALQSLIAEECALTEIHPSISNLTQLQHLRLRKNLLKSEAIDAMISSTSQAGFCGSLKELDLGNNVLTTVPKKLTLLKCLDTLLMSFNRIQSLDGFPWASMQRLSILTLSDNQVSECGYLKFDILVARCYRVPSCMCAAAGIPWDCLRCDDADLALARKQQLAPGMSVVNNIGMLSSIQLLTLTLLLRVQIPAELGRCENLRALLLAGNPQRSIRVNLIQEGTEAVLKYLRNRLPPELQSAPHAVPTVNDFAPSQDTENVPPSNQSATRARDAYNPMEKKRVRTNATQPSSSSAPAQHAATTPSTQVQADDSASANNQLLGDLNKKILALEGSLEDFALTAAKRFALKKELAMVRSQKIRFLRAIQP